MLTMEYIAAVREAYTGPDADWTRPCYSPLFADLRGLPPTLVQVGTNEILKSDSERLVESLQKAGVYAQLEIYPSAGMSFSRCPSTAPPWRWKAPGGSCRKSFKKEENPCPIPGTKLTMSPRCFWPRHPCGPARFSHLLHAAGAGRPRHTERGPAPHRTGMAAVSGHAAPRPVLALF